MDSLLFFFVATITLVIIGGECIMDLIEEIKIMFYEEFLEIGEIAGALRQDPHYIYEVIYKSKE